MPGQVMLSLILITLALVFYTIGVWSERLAGRLKPWHLIFFWGGFVFDTIGTGIMLELAGGLTFDIHGVTGVIAIFINLAWWCGWSGWYLISADSSFQWGIETIKFSNRAID